MHKNIACWSDHGPSHHHRLSKQLLSLSSHLYLYPFPTRTQSTNERSHIQWTCGGTEMFHLVFALLVIATVTDRQTTTNIPNARNAIDFVVSQFEPVSPTQPNALQIPPIWLTHHTIRKSKKKYNVGTAWKSNCSVWRLLFAYLFRANCVWLMRQQRPAMQTQLSNEPWCWIEINSNILIDICDAVTRSIRRRKSWVTVFFLLLQCLRTNNDASSATTTKMPSFLSLKKQREDGISVWSGHTARTRLKFTFTVYSNF